MAAVAVQTAYLSTFLGVSESSVATVLSEPTAELVQSVLAAVQAKANEFETLEAEKLRLEVELENAVRSAETRNQGLKATVEQSLKDVEEIRQKLKQEENARSTLETELQNLRSASSTSSSEVETLQSRISTLETANRDTLGVLEAKSTANDALAQDLQKQHAKGIELAQQIAVLQQNNQVLNSSITSAKFREQNLQQELQLAQRNNDWLDNELKTKSAEALKFRKEKGARIAELQRLNEEANSNLDSLKRTEQVLRSRLEEAQKKIEDSLTKIQQLQEFAAKQEESFRQELESTRRLADLQAQQTETHKNRLKEVETALERAKDDAADEITRARQEAEAERQDREQAEAKIVELEERIDTLEAAATSQVVPGSAPSTPRPGTPSRLNGSVFGTPGSVRKNVMTITQAISEMNKAKAELKTQQRLNQRLSTELDEVLQGLEAKQPELEDMEAEHQRLQQEVVEMSKFVDQISQERDRAKSTARKAESEYNTSQAEINILRQQLRDLSIQIKMLLCDMDARDRGIETLNHDEKALLERLARGEIEESALEGMTETDRFISNRLTVFRSISELQEKNQDLLRITRELGAKMESEEAQAAKHQAAQDHEEVQVLRKRVENYKDELKTMVTRSESYIKERDMFRRMLQHRGQLPPQSDLASMFGESVDGNATLTSIDFNQQSRDNANYAALLRELQSQFDQYREEQSTDRRTMREQMDKMSSEKGSLQSELSKIESQLLLASERYEMLQSNYSLLRTENTELQKRSQQLSEGAAKQDLKIQQVAEELIEAKGTLESLRNENANLKAEKKLLKDIQERLGQDNEGLIAERNRLNSLIASQQSMQNERDMQDSETRRRLQSQLDSLEAELLATKRNLNEQIDENKKAQLRKEFDTQQTQKRIDELVSTLSTCREELVAAQTSKDHLKARVDELTIQLKSAEERVTMLQPRPTPRPATQVGEQAALQEALAREQDLMLEVSELRRDLDLAKAELEANKGEVEQYKNISQAAEEDLQQLNEAQDQYREEMDRIIEEKESKIKEAAQRVEDISSELTAANAEISSMRSQLADATRVVENEKAALQAEITRLKDEEEKHTIAAQFHQQDLRAQAEIATKAQQDYENELVRHAEAAKLLNNLRADYNTLRSDVVKYRTEAESAKAALEQTEASWEEQRKQFEQELAEVRSRRDDVNQQNKLLHEQLDQLSSQLSSMQQNRTSFLESEDASGDAPAVSDRSLEKAHELNRYLRREKDIIEVQYELSIQDCKRLRQQLEYTQSQLEETRLKLDQERQNNADGGRSSAVHKDLMEKLNELNLFRESSITLRNEARQAQEKLTEKSKRVEELLGQIQPLEMQVRELQNLSETQAGEMTLLKEDRDRWEKRTQDILTKYDRIDPAEMEKLKENIAALEALRDSLTAERDNLSTETQPLREKVETLEGEKATWQQTRQKIVEQAKERSRVLTKEKNERIAERDAAIREKEAVEQQLLETKQTLETAIQEKQALEQQLTTLQTELESATANKDQSLALTQAANTPVPANTDQQVNQQLEELQKQLQTAMEEKRQVEEKLATVQTELESARAERDKLATAAASASNVPVANGTTENAEEGEIAETSSTLTDAERQALQERIAAAEAKAKDLQQEVDNSVTRAKQVEESMEATLKARSDKMKSALNQKLTEVKARLQDEYQLKLDQEKQIWLAENKVATTSDAPKTTDGETPTATAPTELAEPATPAQPTPPASGTPAKAQTLHMTDAEVRELIAKNPTVKSILSNNIKKQIDLQTGKLKEEHEKILAEAQKKAEETKTAAVNMEAKKSVLKLNMTENRLKLATVKIQVVEKAVEETPQKPVVEVWEVAKNAKPDPPAQTAAATPAAVPTPTPAPVPATEPAVKAEPAAQLSTDQTTPAAAPATASTESQPQVPATPSATSPGTAETPQPSNAPVQNGQTTQSNIPRSGIPMPRGGGSTRGRNASGIPRGGSTGRGRGRGSMNPGAQSFSPGAGQKHPRDDHQQGGPGGKRMRGGAGGNA